MEGYSGEKLVLSLHDFYIRILIRLGATPPSILERRESFVLFFAGYTMIVVTVKVAFSFSILGFIFGLLGWIFNGTMKTIIYMPLFLGFVGFLVGTVYGAKIALSLIDIEKKLIGRRALKKYVVITALLTITLFAVSAIFDASKIIPLWLVTMFLFLAIYSIWMQIQQQKDN